MKPIICLVGSNGKMAHEFVLLFKKAKITCLQVDLTTKLTLKKAVPQADITLVSVPISKTAQVMREVLNYAKPKSLVTDVTSIKSSVELEFKKSKRTDIEMVGLHPMFGPSMIPDMKNQVIAVCPFLEGMWAEWLYTFFIQHGTVLRKTTAKKHDDCMAVIQGITHFSAIASGMALKKLGVDIETTRLFSSPIYSLRLAMIGRILSQSPELYADIEIENDRTSVAVHAYKSAIDELSKLIDSKNKKKFIAAFNQASKYLGSYTEEAQKETDEIIRFMNRA